MSFNAISRAPGKAAKSEKRRITKLLKTGKWKEIGETLFRKGFHVFVIDGDFYVSDVRQKHFKKSRCDIDRKTIEIGNNSFWVFLRTEKPIEKVQSRETARNSPWNYAW